MPYIAESFIEDLITKSDVVDVINSRVSLKQKGHEFWACCPFHNEKTPSFTVSPDKQFYHCFGCGAHGNAIGFLMSYENLSYVEAIETLASVTGISIVYEQTRANNPSKPKQDFEPIYKILTTANNWFQQNLKTHPNKDLAINYLKERGLDGKTCKKFQIGYAPTSGLIKALGTDATTNSLKAGLIESNDDGKYYERFRERILFPIFDYKSRVIGFGGRTLIDHKAKYYNSPTTEVFHKGKELYGLNQARANFKQSKLALIVEGYMDVVALAQFGINYAVASLGTATTHEQLKILFRSTDKIICCFDGDKAGVNAAIKAMIEALPLMRAGRSLGFMFLPQDEDPDSFIRAFGKNKFEVLITRAHSFDKFMFKFLQKDLNLQQIDDRAKLIKNATEIFKHLPKDTYRDLMLEKLSQVAQIKKGDINLAEPNPAAQPAFKIQTQDNIKKGYKSAQKAIAILVEYPELAKTVEICPIFLQSKHPLIIFLTKLTSLIKNNLLINPSVLIEKLNSIENSTQIITTAIKQNNGILRGEFNEERLSKELKELFAETNKQIRKNKLDAKPIQNIEDLQEHIEILKQDKK